MAPNYAAEAFAYRLRKQMESRGASVRGLGAAADPEDPERGRRRLQRHLSGKHLPSSASRDRYCDALGVTRDELPLPGDAERDASQSALTREMRSLNRRVARYMKGFA